MVESPGAPSPMRAILVLLASLALASCTLDGTADVPGPVNRFDPVAAYPAVAASVGPDARLVKLVASFVREDGTQDLEASYIGYGDPDAYTFVHASGQRDDPSVPVGARRPAAPFERVDVTIHKPRWVSQSVNGGKPQSKKDLGMAQRSMGSADPKEAVAAPGCSFAKLWAAAKQHGAPKGAVAAITYDKSGYELRIDGTSVLVHFDASCRVLREKRP
jgi:hypothetical protein